MPESILMACLQSQRINTYFWERKHTHAQRHTHISVVDGWISLTLKTMTDEFCSDLMHFKGAFQLTKLESGSVVAPTQP